MFLDNNIDTSTAGSYFGLFLWFIWIVHEPVTMRSEAAASAACSCSDNGLPGTPAMQRHCLPTSCR